MNYDHHDPDANRPALDAPDAPQAIAARPLSIALDMLQGLAGRLNKALGRRAS